MAYIGKNLVGVLKENRTVVTSTGDGSTSLELNETPGSVNNVLVFLDGIRQQPTTDYTVSGSMLTFTTGPETGVKIVAIVGNHSGVEPKKGSVTTRKIVDGAVTGQKLADGNIPTSKFTGDLPALDGSNLLGVHSDTIHKSPNDPAINTNTIDGQAVTLGQIWVNTTSGEMYICTDVTENAQHWMNVGAGEGDYANLPPTNPTNATSYTWSENGSHQITFTGGTDVEDGTASHYVVDNITGDGGNLTVSTAEMSAGQAHTFVVGDIGASDITGVTFRVRSKDSDGAYSTGVTITVTLSATLYTIATGGVVPAGEVVPGAPDYKYHVFNSTGTFTVSQVGTDATIDYLVVAGGGSGNYGNPGGAGGAGGLRTTMGTSGRNSSAESKPTISATSYTMTIGGGASNAGGGAGGHESRKGDNSTISGLNITSNGGGGGSFYDIELAVTAGGCGGGRAAYSHSSYGAGGAGTAGQGFDGGTIVAHSGGGYGHNSTGGGGAGQQGHTGQYGVVAPSPGGNGLSNSITGSGVYYAGGGGGGCSSGQTPAAGGNGGGGAGGFYLGTATHGTTNLGGGGGGGGSHGGQGGSGVIIVRYKFQN